MSSRRTDRILGTRLPELKSPTDNIMTSPQKRSPALGYSGIASSKSYLPAPINSPTERGSESRATIRQAEPLIVRPVTKASRSQSSDEERPSGLPRLTGNNPTYRRPSAPSLTSNRPEIYQVPAAPNKPIPMESVHSDVAKPRSTKDDRPRNVLRRKANFRRRDDPIGQSNVDGKVAEVLTTVSPAQYIAQPEHSIGILTPNIQGISYSEDSSNVPTKLPRVKIPKATDNVPIQQIPKEFIGLRTTINTSNLPPPPTPIFTSASSPSTRYSESPGMWSSRGSTPTSLSSYSPGITQPATTGYRFKQQSPIQIRQTAGLRMTTTPVSQIDSDEPTILGPIATDVYTRTPKAEALPMQQANQEPVPQTSSRAEYQLAKSPQISQKSRNGSYDEQDNVDNPPDSKSVSNGSLFKPRRPSRDGTDKLEQTVSPVIRSNLPALRATTTHARRASAEKINSPERLRVAPFKSAAASVESFQSNVSARTPSRNDSTQIPRKAPRTLVKSPKESKSYENTNSTNKYNIFNKKSKVELSFTKSNLEEKASRKGPVAGTGHEGYGKYAQRGRKSSVGNTNGTRARSTSTNGGTSIASSKGSNHQQPDIDDFFLERLEPVVISGGGMDREQLFRTQSGQSSSTLSATSASGSSTFNGEPLMRGYSSESLSSSLDQAKPAPWLFSSDTSLSPQVRRTQHMKSKNTRNEPAPSGIPSFKRDAARGTHEVSEANQDANFSALPPISKVASKSSSTTSPKISNTKPSRRWNFFHRSQKNEQNQSAPVPTSSTTSTETQLHAHVAPVAKSRPVAHYALIEADSDSLEDILHRVEESPPSDDEAFLQAQLAEPTEPALNVRHGTSVLLPSPPTIWKEFTAEGINPSQNRPASPKVFFQKQDESPENKRRSRLAPVGRIPRVVSSRDRERDHKPPSQSYSRPFSRDEAPSFTITAGPQRDIQDRYGRSKLSVETDPFSQGPIYYSPPGASGPFSAPVLSESAKFMSGAYATDEFIRFSPRKQSEVSSSTSEADSILATVASMAAKPNANESEEEIWAEYDDLLDIMMAPSSKTEQDFGTMGPFELVKKASKTLQAEISGSDTIPRVSTTSDTPDVAFATPPARSSDVSVRLRRSKIAAALHSPSPQVSYNDLIAEYSEPNKSLSDVAPPESSTEPPETTSQTQSDKAQSPTPTNTTDFETTRRRNTMLFDMAERMREGAAAQTNLRSASLMTSKWLSFGRVLFSPAHNRIQKSESECILIIDGLGNDDWSYYCALTYPNANIYNLSIRSGSSSSSPHPEAWKPPSNHHLIHHTGVVDTAFPFPKGFFSACVIRFPAASSEDGQRHILSECKRVLRYGGYLEMSVLDLDLVNVGNRTRKAVRNLKEKIYLADSSISLKPASDNFQRLLGICGYDNLNRCMVSIPVAGMIGGSTGSSNSNNTSSDIPSAGTAVSSPPSSLRSPPPHARTPSDEAEPSLGDLLSDPSPSASNDESIAKVVARVGRWWYTRSYEIPVLSDPNIDQSIWAERKILRECQKSGTGFRLLIAYAQKPSEKRRTVSL
ncbi:hypothetical protein UA08_05172 [Talaromyces atroroseus]|uniref:Methyltransferase type 11 domain-containing protein n=1 Tax=Talaromyces atroroseus TaxID=1441469 RepID=A0A225AEM2_TALAT|nr:hypothetical protein UA08_05172 [Talaromyces atroroseus]OKL59721.1 hypothetical protein UA08_05172 [Talaromyces atroroseus]